MYNFKIIFLFFNIMSLKTNTFIPAMVQCHYRIPVVVLHKICKIPVYCCNHLLIRKKTLTSKEEFEFWEEIEVESEPNLGNRVNLPTIHSADPLIFPLPKQFVGGCIVLMKDDFFFCKPGLFSRIFSSNLVKRLE